MELLDKLPHVRAFCRNDSAWLLPVAEKESFLAAWMAGRPFWSGLDLYGQPTVVKLADITGVLEKTAAGIALFAEQEALKATAKLLESE